MFSDLTFFRFDTLVFDQYQRIKPRQWSGSDIVIIDIDEASIKELGQWPWPRSTLAQLTDRLGQLGAATIVFDIVFSEKDRTSPVRAIERLRKAGAQIKLPGDLPNIDNDEAFSEAIARNRVVTGMVLSASASDIPPQPKAGTAVSGTFPDDFMAADLKATRNLPMFDEKATGIGDFSFPAASEIDTIVRRTIPLKGGNGHLYPSLSLEALRVVQGAGAFRVKTSDGSGEVGVGELAIVSVQVGQLIVPTDAQGGVSIYHSPSQEKPTLPVIKVLNPTQHGLTEAKLQEQIANHIVIVGTSAAGLLDLRATPLESVVPGVTIHAEIIDQIISGDWISRPDFARGIELSMAIVAVLFTLALIPILNSMASGVVTLGLSFVVVMTCWVSFSSYNLLISPVLGVLSILSAYAVGSAAQLLITERQGRYVRQAFDRYLSPTMVELLARNPEKLRLGGEEKELTILFCDIRGFTGISEGLDPTELTELLNRFLTPMTTVLLEEGATIDKYMGDAIMAFWNAPLDQEDHHERAYRGLVAMRRELVKLNRYAPRPLEIGIGLNSGPCCVGNLGSSQRFSYSAIGDAVNVSSRIEGMTKVYGVDNLLSEETLEGISDLHVLEVDRVGVVGRDKPLTVFTLLDTISDNTQDGFITLVESHENMLAAYRSGDTETALLAMKEAQDLAGARYNKLYSVYADRLSRMREDGIPDNWDGVFRATEK